MPILQLFNGPGLFHPDSWLLAYRLNLDYPYWHIPANQYIPGVNHGVILIDISAYVAYSAW